MTINSNVIIQHL